MTAGVRVLACVKKLTSNSMSRSFAALGLTLALTLHAGAAHAQGKPPAERFPAELDRYIENVRAQWQIPGIAIAIVRNDSTLVTKGYGVRSLGSPDRVDANTVFDIASLSKSFTATVAAILVDRGVIRWDEPVQTYLPNLVLPNDTLTAQATIRDFLSHRTGIEPANMMWVPTAVTRDEVLTRMRYLRTVAPARRAMVYSNVGYTVAGEAIAAAARRPLEELLRDLVIKPLGLTSTTWTYEQAATMQNLAASHAPIGGSQRVIPRELQRRTISAAAGVQSSANDLGRWLRLHLNNGTLDGKRFVSDSAMRALHSVQVPIATTPAMRAARLVQDSTGIGYGMGWQVVDYRGHRMVWHTGNGDGQIAWMAIYPDDRLGIAVLVNTWSAPNVHMALLNRIADTYLGYAERDWAVELVGRPPTAQRVAALDSARAARGQAMAAMRSVSAPRVPLAAFAGRYDNPAFGPVWIRSEGSGLTLQMGGGRVADLEYHGSDAFYVLWRDPFFRENYGTHLVFTFSGDSVASFTTILNRDRFTAQKAGVQAAAVSPPAPVPARAPAAAEAIVGAWDLRVLAPNDVFASWLEVERSGYIALVGRYVGLIGGARPIAKIDWSARDSTARFTIPSEWNEPPGDVRFEVRVRGDSLTGTILHVDGSMRAFVGKRAPALRRPQPVAWSEPVSLFNGKDFSGWTVAPTARSLPNFWKVRDGALFNDGIEGSNLMTVQRFQDFKLHVEFRLSKGGGAGIFPRGRYWVILSNRSEPEPHKGTTGAIHRFLIPNENASLGPDVWQTVDITLVGRRITVVVNGKSVITDAIVPGVTGSAIDSNEGEPGPIMLQGEEQRVEFRNITISVPSSTLRAPL
jgi:CubicO group peptidase (beta-lactamase class C family)